MSEEVILEWVIYLGLYVLLLIVFYSHLYLFGAVFIVYIAFRFAQSRCKKLLPVKNKAVLITGCDRGKCKVKVEYKLNKIDRYLVVFCKIL